MQVQYKNVGIDEVRVLVDLGANHGQFIRQICAQYSVEWCVAVEMLPDLAGELRVTMPCPGSVHYCVAGAECVESVPVFRCDYDQASSVLLVESRSMELYHRDLTQFFSGCASMRTVDSLMHSEPCIAHGDIDLLKIDVQGYEIEVLAGARETLKRTAFVLIEANCVPCYVGGSTFRTVDDAMRKVRFELTYFLDGYVDPVTGIMVHSDVLYKNAKR